MSCKVSSIKDLEEASDVGRDEVALNDSQILHARELQCNYSQSLSSCVAFSKDFIFESIKGKRTKNETNHIFSFIEILQAFLVLQMESPCRDADDVVLDKKRGEKRIRRFSQS